MKSRIFIFIFLAFAVVILSSAYIQQSAEQLYQSGLYKEEVEGELEKAIEIYERILKQFPENREIAAKAQLHIGLCYEKLGLKEAQKAYQKVVDDFPEQREAVKVAKEKLSTLVRAQTVIKKGDKEFKIRKVWGGPDVDIFGAPSPDGRYLSYVNWMTGDLAVLELATGKKRRLTNEGSWKEPKEFALNSRISPDGKLVAYAWYNEPSEKEYYYDLHLVGIDGSNPRVLYRDKSYQVYPCSWSSDGKQIAASRYGGNGCQIITVSVADGSVRVMKSFDDAFWLQLCYSPDNQYIVYDYPVKKDSGKRDISLLAVDGSGEIPLIEHPANDRLLGWVPESNTLLFLSDRTGTNDALIIQVSNGKTQGLPKPIRRGLGQVSPMAFTQDGSFYFSIHSRWSTIQIAPFDLETGKIQEQISKPILGSKSLPEWSPDGEYLAYIVEQKEPGGGYHRPLHVRNIKTGEERELAGHLEVRSPRWSPDGRYILVTGYDNKRSKQEDYNGGVYKIDVKENHVTLMVEFTSGWWPRSVAEWSKDGEAIFYVNGGKIFMRELVSGREKELYKNPKLEKALDLSPDGDKLVFGIDDYEKDTGALMIMSVTGGEARELCKVKGFRNIAGAVWTPDGKYIIYTEYNQKKGSSYLWRIAVDGGKPQEIWQGKNGFVGLSVHPDGEKIAFSTWAEETEIWMMENFLPLVKK